MDNLSDVRYFMASSVSLRHNEWRGFLPKHALSEFSREAILSEPVTVDIHVAPWEKERFRITGTIDACVTLSCVRCLQSFTQAVHVDVNRFFAPGRDPAESFLESEMSDDITYLSDGCFLLRRMVEEELLLALPMRPLCVVMCSGLCACCGVNLNRESCSCGEEHEENAFSRLADLKLKLKLGC